VSSACSRTSGPFRACFEGRIALETLTRDEISRASRIYHHLVTQYPERATYRVGLAIACVLTCESTRADPHPDREALAIAAAEGPQACELRPKSADGLGDIRCGPRTTRRSHRPFVALQRACALEPDNWLHLCRLAKTRVDVAADGMGCYPESSGPG
jgi:hypothetical protein